MKIDCKEIVSNIKNNLKTEIITDSIRPCLITVQVGDEFESNIYVKKKQEVLTSLGLLNNIKKYPSDISEDEFLKSLKEICDDETINGVLVQLPLPSHISVDKVVDIIPAEKDVDGFTTANIGKMFRNEADAILPCTPKGVLEIIDAINYDLTGKKVLVIGRSNILGKPLQTMLTNRDAVVLTLHSKMEDRLVDYIQDFNPSVIISCVGKKDLITQSTIRTCNLEVLIDCAIVRDDNNKICGDFKKSDYGFLDSRDIKYTTSPGGVGLLTTTMVAKNLIECYKIQKGIK